AKPPTFDVHIPLLSLPHILDVRFETMPSFKPYLRPRERELEDWRGKLKTKTAPENRKKKRVGIAWAGSPAHPNDRNRSMTWEQIAPLVEQHAHHIQFFSLQKGQPLDHPDVIDLSTD